MSVGLQRLREDADAIRRGVVDKGEDPATVDRALELDTRRRTLLGEGDALKAERNATSKRVGAAIKGGAKPDGPEHGSRRRLDAATGRDDDGSDAESALQIQQCWSSSGICCHSGLQESSSRWRRGRHGSSRRSTSRVPSRHCCRYC